MMIKTPIFIVNSFNEGPVFGRLGCSIFGLLGAYVGPCSAVTNAAIAYDRYRYRTQNLWTCPNKQIKPLNLFAGVFRIQWGNDGPKVKLR